MKKIAMLLLCFLTSALAIAQDSAFRYPPPFVVRDSVIYDQNGKKVKLWGVNYLAPFNHNFVNIQQAGVQLTTAIDQDLAQFKKMGVDLVRIHLYDREITDNQGHLLNNDHLKAFDYLVDQAYKNGICLMLTPTVWWNTVENEKYFSENYAYWDLTRQPNFGFSNYFAKDAILWHPEAIACQKTYLKELFEHRNAYSGKRLCDYAHVVAIELTNEPQYLQRLDRPPMGSAIWAKGEKPTYLRTMYDQFLQANHADQLNAEERAPYWKKFRAEVLRRYFAQLWPIVDQYFEGRAIKTHIHYEINDPAIRQSLVDGGIQAINYVAYWNATGKFDGGNTDWNNFLHNAAGWIRENRSQMDPGFARIIYEYGASSSLDGYVIGAFAAAFRRCDVQMCAFFTYTPSAVAEYNPGWLIHYLNLSHTPNKAAAFAAAGDLFRQEFSDEEPTCEPEKWSGPNFTILRKPSNVIFYDPADKRTFRYADSTDYVIPEPEKLETISGRGNSCVVECNGTGFYLLRKGKDPQTWFLSLEPNQKYVSDPTGSKTFQHMANRYMNIDKMPVVSRLLEKPIRFRWKLGKITQCDPIHADHAPKQNPDGSLTLFAGEYRLTVNSEQ
ncbi:MAG: cellulase family glycosylhydrolase [Planctomycetia bacterium]|nr:cellulase family glycosylhydrolase [Planctomycetia bacterium]